jgi:uncharacterized protein YjbI with pentapeptide repeats
MEQRAKYYALIFLCPHSTYRSREGHVMPNADHVTIVEQGAEAICRWRAQHPDENLDLTKANLQGADLGSANLQHAILQGANLDSVNLSDAHLESANL